MHTRIATILCATTLASACTESFDPVIQQHSATSECGGFAAESGKRSSADYCDAEMLYWQYDGVNQTLSIDNDRILHNCCGEHSMTVSEADGVYVVTERDAPEFGDARCGCTCVFDFSVTAVGIPAGVIPLRIIRDVTDAGEPVTVLDETIDLDAGSGSFIIDPQPTDWCGDGPGA